MTLGHEKLDVYRLPIGYVAWVYEKAEALARVHRPARDQWLRASQSIPLNIAEGNGKALDTAESRSRTNELDRMSSKVLVFSFKFRPPAPMHALGGSGIDGCGERSLQGQMGGRGS
jgi:hypothetical protein